MNKTESKWLHNFVTAILSLETEEECENFFEDICTIKEFQDLTHRLEVARLLSEGKQTHRCQLGDHHQSQQVPRIWCGRLQNCT